MFFWDSLALLLGLFWASLGLSCAALGLLLAPLGPSFSSPALLGHDHVFGLSWIRSVRIDGPDAGPFSALVC